MKNNLYKDILLIIIVSIIAGLTYNYFNSKSLPFIREVKIANDSLIDALNLIESNSVDKPSSIDSLNNIDHIEAIKTKSEAKDSIKNIDSTKIKKKALEKLLTDAHADGKAILVSYSQTLKIINLPNTLIYDARPNVKYEQGHIPKSKNLPPDEFQTQIFELMALNKEIPILIYCDGGECDLSHELEAKFRSIGFKKLFIFQGGWEEWTKNHPK